MRGTDQGNFGNLVKGKTLHVVENAWGGYMDAGDWDRRIQHLIVSRYLIELAELYPDYFNGLSLNIPESANSLPDVIDEALFNLDCYRRMQTAEGGIRGGIESAEHPRHGEASWQESLDVMAYAPDSWSSYVYAGVAAGCSVVVCGMRNSHRCTGDALRAMQWAEAKATELQQSTAWSTIQEDARSAIRDARNLAAAELYRLTGEDSWHQVFLSTTKFSDATAELAVWPSHDQAEAAWVYLRTRQPGLNVSVQRNCRAAAAAS